MKNAKVKRETARVSMPLELFKKLKKKSANDMVSLSSVIRSAIKKHLEE